jgi:hypothetical protein
MTQTRWAIDGPDEAGIELGGRRFSTNDGGTPMMCNLVCSSMGRHIHVDYCRAEQNAHCGGPDIQHINARMVPSPDKPKDAITHNLYWRRMGGSIATCPFLQSKTSFTGFKGLWYLFLPSGLVLRQKFRPVYSRRTDRLCEVVSRRCIQQMRN